MLMRRQRPPKNKSHDRHARHDQTLSVCSIPFAGVESVPPRSCTCDAAIPAGNSPVDLPRLKWPIISTTSGGRCMVMRLVRDDEMAEKMLTQVDGDVPP